jgi:hypothetical protein
MGLGIRSSIGIVGALLLVAACGSSPTSTNTSGTSGGNPPAGHVHGGPPPAAAPLRPGEQFQEIGLKQAYQPKPPEGGTDEYRCFLVDPKFTSSGFITGSQFLPQNGSIVHHAILYRLNAAEVDKAKELDAKTEGDGWQCFGGSGLEDGRNNGGGTDWLGAWAPGNNEKLIGDATGYPVEPGTQIVLQVHYNLLYTNGKSGPTDQSSVRLRLLPGTASVTPLQTMLLSAPIELPCSATESGPFCDRNAAIEDLVKRTGSQAREAVDGLNKLCNQGKAPTAGPTQQCDIPVRQPATLYAVAPHMHLLGRSISLELNPGKADARKLLDQPVYNFDDQSSQILQEPVQLKAGDTLRVSCTHDATIRTQLPELKPLKPRYVVWGDGTSDEMCLTMLTGTIKP